MVMSALVSQVRDTVSELFKVQGVMMWKNAFSWAVIIYLYAGAGWRAYMLAVCGLLPVCVSWSTGVSSPPWFYK